ncbi:MAG: hypothetical protein KY455_09055 [Euryarchaeota archaeon]|nr:hypothetical protein [Euryarchaeota archaeon]
MLTSDNDLLISRLAGTNGVTQGTGRSDDPFVIERVEISAESTPAILLTDITAHVIIRNLNVEGNGSTPVISFKNVDNIVLDRIFARGGTFQSIAGGSISVKDSSFAGVGFDIEADSYVFQGSTAVFPEDVHLNQFMLDSEVLTYKANQVRNCYGSETRFDIYLDIESDTAELNGVSGSASITVSGPGRATVQLDENSSFFMARDGARLKLIGGGEAVQIKSIGMSDSVVDLEGLRADFVFVEESGSLLLHNSQLMLEEPIYFAQPGSLDITCDHSDIILGASTWTSSDTSQIAITGSDCHVDGPPTDRSVMMKITNPRDTALYPSSETKSSPAVINGLMVATLLGVLFIIRRSDLNAP